MGARWPVSAIGTKTGRNLARGRKDDESFRAAGVRSDFGDRRSDWGRWTVQLKAITDLSVPAAGLIARCEGLNAQRVGLRRGNNQIVTEGDSMKLLKASLLTSAVGVPVLAAAFAAAPVTPAAAQETAK